MLIFVLMIQTAAVVAPVETATKAVIEPVVVQCPGEPSLIPQFGQSCAAKQQAARVSEVILAADAKTLEAAKADGEAPKPKQENTVQAPAT